MAKGPKTPDEIRIRVNEIYLDLRDEVDYEPRGKEVLEKLKQELLKTASHYPVPSLSQVQHILSMTRKNLDNLGDLDKSWSIGISTEYGIPDDATGELLKVWAQCLFGGKQLTIRQAQWVTRLRWITKAGGDEQNPGRVTTPGKVHEWASMYAGRERAARAAGQRMDTTDLDALLGLESEIYLAAVETQMVPGWSYTKRIEALAEGDPERALTELRSNEYTFSDWKEIEDVQHTVVATFERLPEHSQAEAVGVCDIWLSAFHKKGKGLSAISKQDRFDIVKALAEEVVAYFESGPISARFTRSTDPTVWKPSRELLERVGYEV